MIIFKTFQNLENFYIKFQDFPYFSRICMNPAHNMPTITYPASRVYLATDVFSHFFHTAQIPQNMTKMTIFNNINDN